MKSIVLLNEASTQITQTLLTCKSLYNMLVPCYLRRWLLSESPTRLGLGRTRQLGWSRGRSKRGCPSPGLAPFPALPTSLPGVLARLGIRRQRSFLKAISKGPQSLLRILTELRLMLYIENLKIGYTGQLSPTISREGDSGPVAWSASSH